MADVVQILLQQAQEAWDRAREEMGAGVDPIIVAQDFASAGESLVEASKEIALRHRKARDKHLRELAAKAGGGRG